MTPIYLDDTTLAGLGITPAEIRAAIEDVLCGIDAGRVNIAPKTNVIAPDGRYMMATLAGSDDAGLIAVKYALVNDSNKARGLPGINSAIMLMDAQTGELRATLAGNWITAVRTAGLSTVAAARLADPGSATLALVGAGVQGESHLRAFADQFPLRSLRVFGRSPGPVATLCDAGRALGLEAAAAASPEACLAGADIVVSSVTLDYSIAPFLDARWLSPRAFAAITDLGIPWFDDGMSAFGSIFVDDAAQERVMAKPMVAPERIDGDLKDLVTGTAPPAPSGQPRAFIFRGIAAGDLAVAALAYRRATSG